MKKKTLRMRRLGWAGVEIECDGEILLIDYIQDTSPLVQLRSQQEPFPAMSRLGEAKVALITHLHADHADPMAVFAALGEGGKTYRPKKASGTDADLALTAHAESEFEKYELDAEILEEWQERTVGPFRFTALPSADGFGDPQIAWAVECNGFKIFHGGDTIFHGNFWRIANHFGPFDIAFLPINGAVVDFPLLQPPSAIEAVMTPEQAGTAGHILKAKYIVPIHYASLHKPPMYIEASGSTLRLYEQTTALGIISSIYQPGEWFQID
ncbi:MBL fold metallo-hydrolase [Pedobacter jeongneungensis]|uniref:MBL fold metallo-hydrolase n=1 Tax=Pedobacter jeongneungensis TaxID=947309 RepID=A0ABP8B760_9SPHI